MTREITADANTLLGQASATAEDNMAAAIERIDRQLGDGYAAEHPELIAAFMRVAGDDFRTSMTLRILEGLAEKVTDYLPSV